jgi:hypothetical protein
VTTAAAGRELFSSGPIDFTLHAGMHYVLAVQVRDTDFVAYETNEASRPTPSFGPCA